MVPQGAGWCQTLHGVRIAGAEIALDRVAITSHFFGEAHVHLLDSGSTIGFRESLFGNRAVGEILLQEVLKVDHHHATGLNGGNGTP